MVLHGNGIGGERFAREAAFWTCGLAEQIEAGSPEVNDTGPDLTGISLIFLRFNGRDRERFSSSWRACPSSPVMPLNSTLFSRFT
jgi:hypothetical protein